MDEDYFEKLTDSQKQLVLEDYRVAQKDGFISVMNFVCNKINNLIEKGVISDFVQVRARIKSFESSIHNDENKALDDIFGMEIITATEEEYTRIMRYLKQYMNECKKKDHDKKECGYKAKHRGWTIKEEYLKDLDRKFQSYQGNIPMIEFQFKTSEVFIRCNEVGLGHAEYKGETKKEIQEKYDKGEFNLYNIPIMWASKRINGKLTMELLNEKETLKKIYPFLDTDKERDSR